jgi:UDP-N-acetylglucosamine--N-acetylmuramyl-(pentapeptide) pyrophosphoryl-undecaprenol N-acetylglucosamine transferase
MEADLVKRVGVPFRAISAGQVAGMGPRALAVNIGKLSRGFFQARQILREFRPDVLFFTGGYIGVPVALAARLPLSGMKRPKNLLYVPDIEPGLALKTLVRFADRIAVTTPESQVYFPQHPAVTVTGYPYRRELRQWTREKGRQALNLASDLPVLLVTGGSRGARPLNRFLLQALPQLLARAQVVHVSGQLDWPEVSAAREQLAAREGMTPELAARYQAYPYLHEEMGAALAAADLAVTRAGASTLGELPLFGLPAVLVPYPYAWRYQKVNAAYLAERGAAVMLPEDRVEGELLGLLLGLLDNRERLQSMRAAMSALARPAAAAEIASLLYSLAGGLQQKGRPRW